MSKVINCKNQLAPKNCLNSETSAVANCAVITGLRPEHDQLQVNSLSLDVHGPFSFVVRPKVSLCCFGNKACAGFVACRSANRFVTLWLGRFEAQSDRYVPSRVISVQSWEKRLNHWRKGIISVTPSRSSPVCCRFIEFPPSPRPTKKGSTVLSA